MSMKPPKPSVYDGLDDAWADLTDAQVRGLASPDYYLRCEHDEEPDSNCPYCAGRWCYPCNLFGQDPAHKPCKR